MSRRDDKQKGSKKPNFFKASDKSPSKDDLPSLLSQLATTATSAQASANRFTSHMSSLLSDFSQFELLVAPILKSSLASAVLHFVLSKDELNPQAFIKTILKDPEPLLKLMEPFSSGSEFNAESFVKFVTQDLKGVLGACKVYLIPIFTAPLGKKLLSEFKFIDTKALQTLIKIQMDSVSQQKITADTPAELAVKEALRCKLFCSLELKRILTVNAVEMIAHTPFLSDPEYIEGVFTNLMDYPPYKKFYSLVSYIPVEMLIAYYFVDRFPEAYYKFKAEAPDIEKELVSLFPKLENHHIQTLIPLINNARESVIKFSEGYFELEKNLANLSSQNGYTSKQIAQWQEELFDNMAELVNKQIQDSPDAGTMNSSYTFEKALVKKYFSDPELFSSGDFYKILAQSTQNIDFKTILNDKKDPEATQTVAVKKVMSQADLIAIMQNKIGQLSTPAVKPRKKTTQELLQQACKTGNVDAFKELMKNRSSNGCNITHQELFTACAHGHEKIVSFLFSNKSGIRLGRSINEFMGDLNPLLVAAKNNHAKVVKILLNQKEIDPTVTDAAGHCAHELIEDPALKKSIKLKIELFKRSHAEPALYDQVSTRSAHELKSISDQQEKDSQYEKERMEIIAEVREYLKKAATEQDTLLENLFSDIQQLLTRIKLSLPEKISAKEHELQSIRTEYKSLFDEKQKIVTQIPKNLSDEYAFSDGRKQKKRLLKINSALIGIHVKLRRLLAELKEEEDKIKPKSAVANTAASPTAAKPKNITLAAETKTACAETSPVTSGKRENQVSQEFKGIKSLVPIQTVTFFKDPPTHSLNLGTYLDAALHEKFKQDRLNALALFCEIKGSLVLEHMQIKAILFEIMQWMEKEKDLATPMQKQLGPHTARRIRNAIVHSKSLISENLSGESFQNLRQEVVLFAKILIENTTTKNFSKLSENEFFKKLIAHGEKLDQQQEMVSENERLSYTFTTGSQQILFTGYQPSPTEVFPESLRLNALKLVNIHAQIYGLYTPLISYDEAIEDRHHNVSSASMSCS